MLYPFWTSGITGRSVIVKSRVDQDHIAEVTGVVEITEDQPHATVKLAVWQGSDQAKNLPNQVLVGSKDYSGEVEGERFYVFDPYETYLLVMTESQLSEMSVPEGYLCQVAIHFGHMLLQNALDIELGKEDLVIDYEGLVRFDHPNNPEFGLDFKADIFIGELIFQIRAKT